MKIINPEENAKQLMMTLFKIDDITNGKVTIGKAIILPGQRLPVAGTASHQEDEYSYIMKGDIHTCSDGKEQLVKAGSATFIPHGEAHWCRNDGDTPVEVLWILVG